MTTNFAPLIARRVALLGCAMGSEYSTELAPALDALAQDMGAAFDSLAEFMHDGNSPQDLAPLLLDDMARRRAARLLDGCPQGLEVFNMLEELAGDFNRTNFNFEKLVFGVLFDSKIWVMSFDSLRPGGRAVAKYGF